MLNHSDNKSSRFATHGTPVGATHRPTVFSNSQVFSDHYGDWCVGQPPQRWDVSFGSRLLQELIGWFRRRPANRISVAEMHSETEPESLPLNHPAVFSQSDPQPMRRAA